MSKMLVLYKNTRDSLTTGLSNKEFSCNCESIFCTNVMVSTYFLQCFSNFRMLVEMPVHIHSGHRCSVHNAKVLGKELSFHTAGCAVDIGAYNLFKKYDQKQIEDLALKSGFKFVKYYRDKNFFHFDTRGE